MSKQRNILGAGIGLAVFVTVAFLVPAEYLVPYSNGTIEHAVSSTNLKIKRYEITGLPFELRSWLVAGHDGAPGQEVGVIIMSWAIGNPDEFVYVTDTLEAGERKSMIFLLSYAISDRHMKEAFEEAFANYNNPVVLEIKNEVSRQQR
jgi:hypothetical protein